MSDAETLGLKSRQVKRESSIRDILAIIYFPFLIVWFLLLAWMLMNINMDALAGVGLGSATGIFLAKFGDMWQFYFRKRPGDSK